jgi:hypothetical protein
VTLSFSPQWKPRPSRFEEVITNFHENRKTASKGNVRRKSDGQSQTSRSRSETDRCQRLGRISQMFSLDLFRPEPIPETIAALEFDEEARIYNRGTRLILMWFLAHMHAEWQSGLPATDEGYSRVVGESQRARPPRGAQTMSSWDKVGDWTGETFILDARNLPGRIRFFWSGSR